MRLVQDSLAMIREIFEIRQNWKAGDYTTPTFKMPEPEQAILFSDVNAS
jgi:hypothetical protein